MSMTHWWNESDRRKLKCSLKPPSQLYFVHHKSHTDKFLMDWHRAKLVMEEVQRTPPSVSPYVLRTSAVTEATNVLPAEQMSVSYLA
jgi:hypothetical protein